MKWVLLDRKSDEIVTTAELPIEAGKDGAEKYFLGIKKIDENTFNKLWKVQTKKRYVERQMAFQRPASSDPNRKWWKDEGDWLDLEKS